ncbi:hypothetical protein PsorP6_002298 [Peronosclerospora sorghi]|uniref:Uncharacterized protein n=1 Tax=Peronosclerospora sorghi TaxID=230839 RepID=A0ACC0WWG7_9STRA|nr:hypothetical protein PsorP6_002298 [Peronosclerospora sorghi]
MIVLVSVDNILAFAMWDAKLLDFKASMEATFEVNKFNDINYFLGLEMQWLSRGDEARVGQHKYADTILDRFRMKNARPAAMPMEEGERFDLFQSPNSARSFAVSVGAYPARHFYSRSSLAQETERPTAALKAGIEHFFRYLGSTKEHGLRLRLKEIANRPQDLSSSIYDGKLVEWGSKKKVTVTLSSTEAEYIAMATGLHECIGIMLVLKDRGIVTKNIVVMEDKQGAQHLEESKGVTQRSRHINTK